MNALRYLLWASALLACAEAAARPPAIEGVSSLSALPNKLSLGSAGPINRLAFDLLDFDAAAGDQVECRYAHATRALRYRCRVEAAPARAGRQRLVVELPDLDRGRNVLVRFSTAAGAAEHRVELANPPQLIHEIETLLLPEGGEVAVGPDGARRRVDALRTWSATSAPGLTVSLPYLPERCDAIYAQWSAATATDPVFASEFGALNGAVGPQRAPVVGSAVRSDNLPEWSIRFPASATRLQFIAHYEVTYRVGTCAERIIRGS